MASIFRLVSLLCYPSSSETIPVLDVRHWNHHVMNIPLPMKGEYRQEGADTPRAVKWCRERAILENKKT